MLRRLLLNLFAGWFRLSLWFPMATMHRIRDAKKLVLAARADQVGEI